MYIVSQFWAKNTSPASSQLLKLIQEITGNDAKGNWSFDSRPLQRVREVPDWAGTPGEHLVQPPAGSSRATCSTLPGACPADRTSPLCRTRSQS